MSSYDELLSYTKQLERRLAKLERQEVGVSVAGGDHGTLSGLGDDDHSIYLLASSYGGRTAFGTKWTDLTDAGATTLHKHDHGGMDGLGDDDHSIYLLASAATNRATFAANWTDLTDTGATTLHKHDHGGMDGLGDDDHVGYARLIGRSGGQSLIGGTAANDDLTLEGTSNATRTSSYVILQPNGGNVGIGTSAPDQVLHAVGAIAISGAAAALKVYDRTNGAGKAFGLYVTSNVGHIYSWGLAGNVMSFTEAGSVGVGTSSPGEKFAIQGGNINIGHGGSADVYAKLETDSRAWIIGVGSTTADDKFNVRDVTANATRLLIDTSGNVGIGTTAPATALHIAYPGIITLDTYSGGAKYRLGGIPSVSNWGASSINANFNGSAWDLDDTTKDGWFFKLDARSTGNTVLNGMWLYRIPTGANSHTDEYAAFGVTNGAAYFRDSLGVGTTSPDEKLHVSGGHALLSNAYYYSAENASGTNIRLAGIDSSNNVYLGAIDNAGAKVFIREDGADVITLHAANVGIGTGSPNGKLQVEGKVGIKTGVNAIDAQMMVYQDSSTGTCAVVDLVQEDVSEEFINFRSAVGASQPIDTAALGTYYGKVRVAVNGTFKFLALYNS